MKEEIKRIENQIKRETFIALLIVILIGSATICNAQSGAFWRHKQKGGLETYTKYKMGWPYAQACATYQSGNPTKPSYIRRYYSKSKRQYLRHQKRKRLFKRFGLA